MEYAEKFILYTAGSLLLFVTLARFVISETWGLAREVKKLMSYIGNYELKDDERKPKMRERQG